MFPFLQGAWAYFLVRIFRRFSSQRWNGAFNVLLIAFNIMVPLGCRTAYSISEPVDGVATSERHAAQNELLVLALKTVGTLREEVNTLLPERARMADQISQLRSTVDEQHELLSSLTTQRDGLLERFTRLESTNQFLKRNQSELEATLNEKLARLSALQLAQAEIQQNDPAAAFSSLKQRNAWLKKNLEELRYRLLREQSDVSTLRDDLGKVLRDQSTIEESLISPESIDALSLAAGDIDLLGVKEPASVRADEFQLHRSSVERWALSFLYLIASLILGVGGVFASLLLWRRLHPPAADFAGAESTRAGAFEHSDDERPDENVEAELVEDDAILEAQLPSDQEVTRGSAALAHEAPAEGHDAVRDEVDEALSADSPGATAASGTGVFAERLSALDVLLDDPFAEDAEDAEEEDANADELDNTQLIPSLKALLDEEKPRPSIEDTVHSALGVEADTSTESTASKAARENSDRDVAGVAEAGEGVADAAAGVADGTAIESGSRPTEFVEKMPAETGVIQLETDEVSELFPSDTELLPNYRELMTAHSLETSESHEEGINDERVGESDEECDEESYEESELEASAVDDGTQMISATHQGSADESPTSASEIGEPNRGDPAAWRPTEMLAPNTEVIPASEGETPIAGEASDSEVLDELDVLATNPRLDEEEASLPEEGEADRDRENEKAALDAVHEAETVEVGLVTELVAWQAAEPETVSHDASELDDESSSQQTSLESADSFDEEESRHHEDSADDEDHPEDDAEDDPSDAEDDADGPRDADDSSADDNEVSPSSKDLLQPSEGTSRDTELLEELLGELKELMKEQFEELA